MYFIFHYFINQQLLIVFEPPLVIMPSLSISRYIVHSLDTHTRASDLDRTCFFEMLSLSITYCLYRVKVMYTY